jgi:hypothetical protein
MSVPQVPRDPPSRKPDPHADWVPADDRIIGRIWWWSVLVLLGLGGVGLAGWLFLRPSPVKPVVRITPAQPPAHAAPLPAARLPVVAFRDVTRSAGIGFVHNNGGFGEKLLPETMGGGVAFFDFDQDGDFDLLLINGTRWPFDPGTARPVTTPALYRNDGRGQFTEATQGSGLDVPMYGMGVACGDYDNDGLPDVFIATVGGGRLFHNLGQGRFSETTASAGVGGSPQDWGSSCAFLDYDNDGLLDLFVCQYVKWSRAIDAEVGYKIDGQTRAYGQPVNFEGAASRLYHNLGQGRFADVSAAAGIQVKNAFTGVPGGKALGVAPVDVDGDGWIDLVVANDTVQNFLFHNQRNGTFQEIGAKAGLAFDGYGNARGAMGIDAARFRDDGALGIAIGNFANEMNALYVASPAQPWLFTDEAITEGVGPASRLFLKFGVFFFDYDLDGRLDLLTANGHLEEEITKIQASQQYRQPAQLFWNAGPGPNGCYWPVPPASAGADLFQPRVGRGSAFADIDGDGDLDVVFTQVNGPPLLLRNDQNLGHHWLRLKLVGTRTNRDAIGAWVRVQVGRDVLWRGVMPTRGYLSQSEPVLTFGLGTATRVDAVEIHWPGGATQWVTGLALDALHVVRQAGP